MKNIILLTLISIGCIVLHAQRQPETTLRVNDAPSATIQPGYPVVISLSILIPQPPDFEALIGSIPDTLMDDPVFRSHLDSLLAAPGIIQDSSMEWHNRVVFSYTAEGQRRRFSLRKVVIKPYPAEVFSSTPNMLNVVYFGIDPETTARWNTGRVHLKAGYVSVTGGDTLWSGTATITIEGEPLKSPVAFTMAQLRFTADYLIRRERCDKALDFAEELMRRDSTVYENTSIMAEVRECLKDIRGALNYYIRALDQFDAQAEPDMCPPVILYRKINELQMQLLRTAE